MTRPFRTAAVIGAGTVGLSWTALFAAHGLTVQVSDPRPDLEDATDEALAEFAPHLAAQGLDTDGLAGRVHLAADVAEAVRDADVVQENGPERVEFKKELFAQLIRETPGHALLLSSSSAIPATAFSAGLEDAGRVLVGHPFNPPHLMPLVEVVPGERTTEEAVHAAVDFYTAVGRTPVVERQEMPGFVGNRLQSALSREAVYLVQQGVISPEDLDTVVTHSLGIRWSAVGPFLGSHLGGGPGGYRHMSAHIGQSMQQLDLGQPSQDPQDRERVIEAVEKAYAATPYTELAEARDRKQLAVLAALDDVRRTQHDKEN
ncbi:3-hydroxyacyl-CoA dehydrogenase NAD-binding domain-containing protein [Streptomyces sp. MI02-7b]|uniref:3-hydroxyacyl-CoA dehydrogenase NAD-binding domain-containing protein n=1 Tax=Streptomyces sp. MI02-7b TaxID=462941 RepID=UPI0029BAAE46|nr:3-hydroxyacyl-CoA dehydrogenase NAD-binding domain-containing protein [Streptomyces sp. MI02-7b]MDX3071551.1 3-hydroxyacyl-CoA dehydrogenase NAD-binding domain-containing protein [Streptomyces sp. MI02-7b]